MNCTITEETIRHGETYEVTAQPKDAAGDPLVMDGTWEAAIRITRKKIGGELLAEPAMTIAEGVASVAIDTGESPWDPGVYFWDVRLTDPDGHDVWTDPVKLTLLNRNTPAS